MVSSHQYGRTFNLQKWLLAKFVTFICQVAATITLMSLHKKLMKMKQQANIQIAKKATFLIIATRTIHALQYLEQSNGAVGQSWGVQQLFLHIEIVSHKIIVELPRRTTQRNMWQTTICATPQALITTKETCGRRKVRNNHHLCQSKQNDDTLEVRLINRKCYISPSSRTLSHPFVVVYQARPLSCFTVTESNRRVASSYSGTRKRSSSTDYLLYGQW